MRDLGGESWSQVVNNYLATELGMTTSADVRALLYGQNGLAMGFDPARHGVEDVHAFRLVLEGFDRRRVRALTWDHLARCTPNKASLAMWLAKMSG